MCVCVCVSWGGVTHAHLHRQAVVRAATAATGGRRRCRFIRCCFCFCCCGRLGPVDPHPSAGPAAAGVGQRHRVRAGAAREGADQGRAAKGREGEGRGGQGKEGQGKEGQGRAEQRTPTPAHARTQARKPARHAVSRCVTLHPLHHCTHQHPTHYGHALPRIRCPPRQLGPLLFAEAGHGSARRDDQSVEVVLGLVGNKRLHVCLPTHHPMVLQHAMPCGAVRCDATPKPVGRLTPDTEPSLLLN